MRLSVIIPTHQNSASVLELMDSIIQQEFPTQDLEVLIVSSLADFRLKSELKRRFQHFPNWRLLFAGRTGLNLARNHGIDKARGDYLLFLDQDSLLPDRKFLSRLLSKFAQYPDVSGVGGSFILEGSATAADLLDLATNRNWLEQYLHPTQAHLTRQLFAGNVCYQRKVLSQGVRFDEKMELSASELELNAQIVSCGGQLMIFDDLAILRKRHLSWWGLGKLAFSRGMDSELRRRHHGNSSRFSYSRPLNQGHDSSRWLRSFYRFAYDRGTLWASACDSYHTSIGRIGFFFLLSLMFDLRNGRHWLRSRWGRFDIVEPLPEPMGHPRYYSVWLPEGESPSCPSCQALKSNVSHARLSFEEQIQRAKHYRYAGLIFPCHFIWSKDWLQVLERCLNENLKPIIRLPVSDISESQLQQCLLLRLSGCGFEVILGSQAAANETVLKRLRESETEYWPTLILNSNDNLNSLSQLAPADLSKLRLVAPLGLAGISPSHSLTDLHRRVRAIRKFLLRRGCSHEPRGPQVYNLYEPRIQRGRDLDPIGSVVAKSTRPASAPLISVIIPAYQAAEHLPQVLESLRKQSLNPEKFELLLINDGSSDSTENILQEFAEKHQGKINFTALSLSRTLADGTRDTQFRAGLARNLGASYANGQFLSFLDSDLIVPPQYLEELLLELQTHDVIQARRLMLDANSSRLEFSWNEHAQRDRFVTEDSYWENFKNATDWMSLQNYWKFTCTYSLTLSKQLFERAGWFRNSFFRYGLEDTDLGYRVYLMGSRFHLSRLRVFHLHPNRQEFESNLNREERRKNLSVSSRIFYYHHLSDVIYAEFGGLILDLNRWSWKWGQLKESSRRFYTALVHHYGHRLTLIALKPYFFARYQLQKRVIAFLPDHDS